MRSLFGFGRKAENAAQPVAEPSPPQPEAAALPTSTVFTCVKNEASYLLEWIAYHRLRGFDEIAVYDNGSTDGTRDLLEPLAQQGEIHYRVQEDIPKVSPQHAALRDAIRLCTTDWLLFIDADEFLMLPPDMPVNAFLARFGSEVSQISINWRLFGSGGHKTRTEGLVIERFVRASLPDDPANAHVKSFTRPKRFQGPHVHAAQITGGLAVHDDGEWRWMPTPGIAERISHNIASVHHYVVKSREEFDGKIARGRGNLPVENPQKRRHNPQTFFDGHDKNDVRETAALLYVPKVRAEMARLERLIQEAAVGAS